MFSITTFDQYSVKTGSYSIGRNHKTSSNYTLCVYWRSKESWCSLVSTRRLYTSLYTECASSASSFMPLLLPRPLLTPAFQRYFTALHLWNISKCPMIMSVWKISLSLIRRSRWSAPFISAHEVKRALSGSRTFLHYPDLYEERSVRSLLQLSE